MIFKFSLLGFPYHLQMIILPPTLEVLYLNFIVFLIVLASIPGTMKNNNGDNRYSCFVPDLNEKLLVFLL